MQTNNFIGKLAWGREEKQRATIRGVYLLFRLNVYETPVWLKSKDKGLSYPRLGDLIKNKQTETDTQGKSNQVCVEGWNSGWFPGSVSSMGSWGFVCLHWACLGPSPSPWTVVYSSGHKTKPRFPSFHKVLLRWKMENGLSNYFFWEKVPPCFQYHVLPHCFKVVQLFLR